MNIAQHFPHSDPSEIAGAHNQFGLHTVLIALRCWWKIVLPASVVLSVGAAGAVYALHKPTYTAEAWLLIKSKQEKLLLDVRGEDSKKFIANQLEIIRSPRLIDPLFEDPNISSVPELARVLDPKTSLAAQLKLKARGQSEIYVLSFTSASPQKAANVVKQVTDAYQEYSRKTGAEQDANVIKLLGEQQTARFQEMQQQREIVRTLSIQQTGIDPFKEGARPDSKPNTPTQNPLASVQGEIVNLKVEQEVLAARIKSEEGKQATPPVGATPLEIEKLVEVHPQYSRQRMMIEELKKKEEQFQKTAKNLDNNVAYKQVQQDIAKETAALEALRVKLRDEVKVVLERTQVLERANRLRSMEDEFQIRKTRLSVLESELAKNVDKAKVNAIDFKGTELDLEFRRAHLEQITKVHDEINARILNITTEQRAPQRVELFKEVTIPNRPDVLTPWKPMTLAALLGFMFPLGLVVAWEHLFCRVSSREQIEAGNTLIVVGEVTSLPKKQRGGMLSAHKTSRDVMLFEESVDSLRTYLSFVQSLKDLQILAVGSAVSGEGKTSLAAQLAVSLARATGEPTLLIDGDMRSPDLHDIFGIELTPGLADVLKDEATLAEAINTSFSEKLHVLPAGRLTASPHRLLSRGSFPTLLEKLKQSYRYIVIDTPPVLPASESLLLSNSADAAVICMRRDYSRLHQVQEAYKRMLAAGVNVAGAVLNGIPVHQYAYKYGSYIYDEALADKGSQSS